LVPNPKVLEITAEDPAETFMKLRDFVDATNCMKLSSFSPLSKLKIHGFTKDLVDEANAKLKMGKKQIRRVYEILRLKTTSAIEADEFKAYRLDIKQRLYKPFKRNKNDWRMLNKVLTTEETVATAACMTTENVHLTLQALYDQTMDDYRPVLDRLAAKYDLPEISMAKTPTA